MSHFYRLEGWGLLSQSILNKFAPRHTIFLQELHKKKEENQKEIDIKQRISDEKSRLRKFRRHQRKQALKDVRSNPTPKDFFGYISAEKPSQKKEITESDANNLLKKL
jgi:hypothetical protein